MIDIKELIGKRSIRKLSVLNVGNLERLRPSSSVDDDQTAPTQTVTKRPIDLGQVTTIDIDYGLSRYAFRQRG
ncbi:MAG: hypothetical protein ACR2PI_17545 [Hyphomicrobiaceae bacterium]